MKTFLDLGSYIFHPLWLSTYAMCFYFYHVNFMFTYENMIAKILSVILLTVFIPIFFLILLKPLRIIDSFHLKKIKQRRLPLLFYTTMSAIIINYIFDPVHYKVPFYFFSAVFFSGLVCVILSFLNYKISLHTTAISSFSYFIISFSLYYQIDKLWIISLSVFAVGWVMSSRLSMKSHKLHELVSGLILGVVSQLIFLKFWFI
ncbi:hypothetical protein [Flavobacterium sp. CS20]|uniref:hypothetical protein n=1 Tax=Flavobacterium sp. CS20 TaxID=2775246 RepID=UPI001B3A0B6B|nr:hypothetical protein [Flavobacterium sp. CS20]QTY26205.1 hypothetical protein IGB25_09525 [Flavobacterium sp. CS20]